MQIVRYSPEYKSRWDQFIKNSKNGFFMFNRDYMEYHSDRFDDFSLMFFEGNKLVAVMPANIEDNIMISHGGLTYGGIISDAKMNVAQMLKSFKILNDFLKENKIEKLVYKAIPYIFHVLPAQEDLYALYRNNAKLIRRDTASIISNDNKIKFSRLKRRNIKKCKEIGLKCERSFDFKEYMKIKEEDLLKNHGIKPVHTPDEIEYLANKFPDNIKLFTAKKDDNILAGCVIYESSNVAHAQYSASTDEGKEILAIDFLFDHVIKEYENKKYFDFGISTEDNGNYLNKGLIRFKELFGARAITYDFYEIDIV